MPKGPPKLSPGHSPRRGVLGCGVQAHSFPQDIAASSAEFAGDAGACAAGVAGEVGSSEQALANCFFPVMCTAWSCNCVCCFDYSLPFDDRSCTRIFSFVPRPTLPAMGRLRAMQRRLQAGRPELGIALFLAHCFHACKSCALMLRILLKTSNKKRVACNPRTLLPAMRSSPATLWLVRMGRRAHARTPSGRMSFKLHALMLHVREAMHSNGMPCSNC